MFLPRRVCTAKTFHADLSLFDSGERGRLKPAPEQLLSSSEVEPVALKLSDPSNGRSWEFVPEVTSITPALDPVDSSSTASETTRWAGYAGAVPLLSVIA
ncbi:hypothetical protein [Rhodococcus sp. R1101]|uniref:hypothetical protein n=1 Tax=Rhodococcus sp. R1101 TaxID=1170698 RepID=UPI0002F926E7|nr:hypothetical protein [Rhodococcus sp. R1101]